MGMWVNLGLLPFVNAYLLLLFGVRFEFDIPVCHRKESIVLAQSYVLTGLDMGPVLAHYDRARADKFAVITLDA